MPNAIIFVASMLVAGIWGAAQANVIYNVNRAFTPGPSVYGSAGSVEGTITTDGTLGFLQQNHIVDWNLSLTSETRQWTIDPKNSFFEYETDDPAFYDHGLYATADQLDFRFGFSFGSLYTVFSFYGGSQYSGATANPMPNLFVWCIGTNFCANDLGFSEELILIRDDVGEGRTTVIYSADGQETVASSVPLPAGAALSGSLALAAACVAWRQRIRHSQAIQIAPTEC